MFTLREKLKIINKGEITGNTVVDEYMIYWNCVLEINIQKINRSSFKENTFSSWIIKYPQLEKTYCLIRKLEDRHQNGYIVSTEICQLKVINSAMELNINTADFR